MFIGTHEIETSEVDGDFTKIVFKDGLDLRIKTELLEAIQTEAEDKGSYADVISFHFAKKFLAELSINELPASYVEVIPQYMSNILSNSYDDLIDKTFGGRGGRHYLPINKILS